MKAAEIADRLIEELRTGRYRHARVNFANGDMVGHTGHLAASIQAVEAVDLQVGRLISVIESLSGALLVTADHGNADCMYEIDENTNEALLAADGRPRVKTSHTLNPVPLHVFAPGVPVSMRRDLADAGLANLAATVLHLLGHQAPEDFQPSLLDS